MVINAYNCDVGDYFRRAPILAWQLKKKSTRELQGSTEKANTAIPVSTNTACTDDKANEHGDVSFPVFCILTRGINTQQTDISG